MSSESQARQTYCAKGRIDRYVSDLGETGMITLRPRVHYRCTAKALLKNIGKLNDEGEGKKPSCSTCSMRELCAIVKVGLMIGKITVPRLVFVE